MYAPVFRISLVREGKIEGGQISESKCAVSVIKATIPHDTDREHFVILLLNRKNKVIGANVVAIGSLSACIVHPREVFKSAILANAAAIICAHNHPSGDVQPSLEDDEITGRLRSCGEMLGIPLLDSIIVEDGNEQTSYYSYADMGRLSSLRFPATPS